MPNDNNLVPSAGLPAVAMLPRGLEHCGLIDDKAPLPGQFKRANPSGKPPAQVHAKGVSAICLQAKVGFNNGMRRIRI